MMQVKSEIEIWGGIEYTLNRVGDTYHDQLEYTGHYYRQDDIDTIATLGIKTLRYPILWERHQPQKEPPIDWSFTEKNLHRLQELNIKPIAGLVHHGSGPMFVNFFDGSFEQGLAEYAEQVARKFPWINYYTPVNEPLTTARFCGLYGHWYPHRSDEWSFYKILLSECKASVMAMQAIKKVNPSARLVQTEDLGKTYSTPLLQYQADFDNQRRWLSFDLLCGKVNEQHPLWDYLTDNVGIAPDELHYFLQNNCPPDICGLNYYMTSERYLDEDLEKYPAKYHSGNGRHSFADVERVRVSLNEDFGAHLLLKEAYEHLQLPLAITECHLHCTRDEQMRWFNEMWHTVHDLQAGGADIIAITAWALFGTYGWDKLMLQPGGTYETGAFKVTSGYPQPTAFARLLQSLTSTGVFHHPLLKYEGWWKRDIRCFYGITEAISIEGKQMPLKSQPLLIIGQEGVLSTGFQHICYERNIPYVFAPYTDAEFLHEDAISNLLRQHKPWAVIDIERYDEAANYSKRSVLQQNKTAVILAAACKQMAIQFVSFSPEPGSSEGGRLLYGENNNNTHICIYQANATPGEKAVLKANKAALLIRTGTLFSPWDETNFINRAIVGLQQCEPVVAAFNNYTSFTYVPDLVHIGLDWLLDNESGVFSFMNHYSISEAYLATRIAELGGFDKALVKVNRSHQQPPRRIVQLLPKESRVKLPHLEDALQRLIETVVEIRQEAAGVAV